MKCKLFVFFVVLTLVLALCACNGSRPEQTDGESTASGVATEGQTVDSQSESSQQTAVTSGETESAQSETQTRETDTATDACEHSWSFAEADGGHIKKCTNCGEQTREAHVFEMQERGQSHICLCGAAQDCGGSLTFIKTSAGHRQKACDVCGIDGELKAHEWDYTAKKRTCTACKFAETCSKNHYGYDAESHWINSSCEICRVNSTGKSAHEVGFIVDESTHSIAYKYGCAECGMMLSRRYMSRSLNFYALAGSTLKIDGVGATSIAAENDLLYERITLSGERATVRFGGDGTNSFEPTDALSGGTGRYLVLQFRAHNVTDVSLLLNCDATDCAGEFAVENAGASRNGGAIAEDEWLIYVIDLEQLDAPFYPAESKDAQKIAVGLSFTGESDAYIDVAAVAVCDSWGEVAGVAGKAAFLTAWRGESSLKKVNCEDGSAFVNTKGEDADRVLFSKTGEKMYIYLRSPYTEKYTRYEFRREVVASTNYDSWKIMDISICDSSLGVLYTTVVGACELEGAIKDPAAADFIGGWHGDEYLVKLTVLIDGAELDMSLDYPLTACESIQAVVESYLNRCETTQKAFERTRINTWTEQGLEIHNRFVAVESFNIHRAATSMLAIAFKDGIITEHKSTNMTEWTEIPDYKSQNGVNIQHNSTGVTKAELRGKIYVSVEMTKHELNGVQTSPFGSFSYDHFGSDSARRIKIYIEPFYNVTMAAGDVLEIVSFQQVFALE